MADFKFYANSTIEVDNHFCPLYNKYVLTKLLKNKENGPSTRIYENKSMIDDIIAKYIDEFEPNMNITLEGTGSQDDYTAILRHSDKDSLNIDGNLFTSKAAIDPRWERTNPTPAVSHDITASLNDFLNSTDTSRPDTPTITGVNVTLHAFFHFLFLKKNNFTELLKNKENLIILPVYENDNDTSTLEIYFKQHGLKDNFNVVDNEYYNFLKKSAEESTDSFNNIFYLKCIPNKDINKKNEEEYKERLDDEFKRLNETIQTKFKAFISATTEIKCYKKIIIFRNDKDQFSIDYYKDNLKKETKDILTDHLNTFLSKNEKNLDPKSGIQKKIFNKKLIKPNYILNENYKSIISEYDIKTVLLPKIVDKKKSLLSSRF